MEEYNGIRSAREKRRNAKQSCSPSSSPGPVAPQTRPRDELGLVPAEVQHEVTVAGSGLPGAEEVRNANWSEVASLKSPVDPSLAEACQDLGAGERGAILLAKSLQADVVLLDE